MVHGMKPGSVLVDLAAETGGNCELTVPGETVEVGGVTLVGPLNLPSMGAIHSSDMYARNLFNFLSLMIKDGSLNLDFEDDLIAGTCLTHGGEIRHPASKQRVEGGA
jgi:H+-translocating NAD(P) transhydrogenase subunit alpha